MGGALVARLWGRRDRDVRGRPDGGVASLLWVRASIAKALEEFARPATRGRTRRASTRCPCSGTRDAPTSVSRRPRQPRARAGSPGRVRERPRSRGAGGPAPRRAPAAPGRPGARSPEDGSPSPASGGSRVKARVLRERDSSESVVTLVCRGMPAAILSRRIVSASRARRDVRGVGGLGGMAGLRVAVPGRRVHPWYRWAVLLYDRAYRAVHGLDRPPAQVGPALCVGVRPGRPARRAPDGHRVPLGDRIGVFHVNNARIAAVHVNGQPPLATGLEVRRWFGASLHELAQLAADGGPLADVRAFSAITIFHRGLSRLGFRAERNGIVWPGLTAAYQRAAMASLHPAGPVPVSSAAPAPAPRPLCIRPAQPSRYT